MNISPERARELRRRHRHERQAVIFGGLIALMAVLALGATAVYTGVINAPFAREFTTLAPEQPESTTAAPPCAPPESLPVAYGEIQVRVLNGTGRPGLAGTTATELAARGFAVVGTGNSPRPSPAAAEVLVGENGVTAGYTVAAQIEGAVIQLDTRADASVDLIVGETWSGMLDPGLVPLEATLPLEPAPGCVPIAEALATAGSPPAIDGQEDPAAPEEEAEAEPEA